MGLDISAHPIDANLFAERLVPFVRGEGSLDDLIERAADIAAVAWRANAWGLGVQRVSQDMFMAQFDVAPRRMHRIERLGPEPSSLAKLFGAKRKIDVDEVELRDPAPGLPGFDSDLAVWGRPFFIVGADPAKALVDYARYMACARKGAAAIDEIAREMIAALEAGRDNVPPDTAPEVLAALKRFPPLPSSVAPDTESGAFDRARFVSNAKRRVARWQAVFAARKSNTPFDFEREDAMEEARAAGEDVENQDWDQEASDPVPARELLGSLPHDMAGFYAALQPGWMGRGNTYASFWLPKANVRANDLITAPDTLFEPLIKDAPEVADALSKTIACNYVLGGYIPPERVGAFIERIEQNRVALQGAWGEPASAYGYGADYLKMLEPARFAAERGFGYLEAAEIYSGPFGMLN